MQALDNKLSWYATPTHNKWYRLIGLGPKPEPK